MTRGRAESGTRSRRTSPVNASAVAGALVAALLVLWIVVNRDRVDVSFLVATLTMPLWGALASAAGLGALAGYLLGRRRGRGVGR